MPKPLTKFSRQGGRQELLQRLKQLGPVSADGLAGGLGISGQAVRQQLAALAAEGLVEASPVPASGPGRPRALWQVTPAAARHFAEGYQELLEQLLELLGARHGGREVARLLGLRTGRQVKAYRARITAGSLSAQLEQLAQLRTGEGYMAEVRPQAEAMMLIEHHCPLQAVARRHRALCDEEQKLFERLLGDGVRVERCEHALTGAARCSYLIRAERKTAA